jgi:hypothetical protein
VLTVDLIRENRIAEAENFADAFAGAFLFPEAVAEEALAAYRRLRTDARRIALLCEWAGKHVISPNSVYREMRKCAETRGETFTAINENTLHAAISRFNQKFPSLAEHLFSGDQPSANEFMRVAQENFGTEFFRAFANYVREKRPSPSGIASILSVNPMDARAYFDALAQ